MPDALTQNPILNSPYSEPCKHFDSNERGLTDEVLDSRPPSRFYIPVPRAKTKQKQLDLNLADGAFGVELQKENEFINKIRVKIKEWRDNTARRRHLSRGRETETIQADLWKMRP